MKTLSKTTAFQQGFTLVELLVALFLGLFLTGAVIQSFLSTRATYETTQDINRVQENSRFSYHFLSRDLRETTSVGCLRNIRDMTPVVNEFNNLRVKVGGWDYDGTSPGDADDLSGTYAVDTNRGQWSGLNSAVGTDLPGNINSIGGSDSLLIKKISHITGVTVATTTSGVAPNIGRSSVSINGYVPQVGEELIVGDCFTADKFVVNTVSTTGSTSEVTATGTQLFRQNWSDSSLVHSVSYVNYYIGLRMGADVPSLFRLSSAPGAQAEELVDGVESLQILYGLDGDGDNFASQYVSARDVGDWTDVVNTRIGLLYVVPDGVSGPATTAVTPYQLADSITLNASAGDNDLRYVSNLTIRTRNLGLSEDFSTCLAISTDPLNATCNTIGYVVAP